MNAADRKEMEKSIKTNVNPWLATGIDGYRVKAMDRARELGLNEQQVARLATRKGDRGAGKPRL